MRMALLLTAVFVTTRMALAALGVYPAIPYSLAIAVAFGALPLAVCAAWAGTKRMHPALATVCGLGVVAAESYHLMWCGVSATALLINRDKINRRLVISVLGACGGVLLFYACVFDCNYLAALFVHHRLHDEQLARCDRAIYGWLFGKADVSYVGIFPLIHGRLFYVFENAYSLLFGEIVLTALLMRKEPARFLTTLGVAYGTGLICFLLFPAVGPPIYFPDAFSGFAGSVAAEMGKSEHLDFQALLAGGRLNGLGYFVAVPSLHVLASIVLQGMLRRNRTLFWAFVPINAAVIASTLVLGQHYVVDVAAGGIAGAVLWRFTFCAKKEVRVEATLRDLGMSEQQTEAPALT